MPSLFLLFQVVVLAVLLALLGILLVNLRVLPRVVDYEPQSKRNHLPTVAVLVPARNEEANIEACLSLLLAQDYPHYEVWLYDDASTDNTLQLARQLARESAARGRGVPLHIVEGKDEPPPGWLGKASACHRLYLAARSGSAAAYLLFTDADVRFEPRALRYAVGAAQALDAGLLSIFPAQITVTWAERLAVPVLLHWAVYTFLPLPLAFTLRIGPAFAAANGQFMLFSREAYEAADGHATVRAQVLEDVALARAVSTLR